jgi:hypothetical protein
MAHKGYTTNYFINFFKNIPDHRWITHRYHRTGTVQKCALGHAYSDLRASPDTTPNTNRMTARVRALDRVIGSPANINDGQYDFKKLGKTPRGRILRALRNKKRYGNIFGKKS